MPIQWKTPKQRQAEKKKVKKEYEDVYIPKPEELNVWLPDMGDDDYFRLPREFYSSSGIMKHFRSDNKSEGIFEYIRKHTPALQIGSLVHAWLLTPEILPDLKDTVSDLMERFPEKIDKHGKIQPSALDRVDGAVMAAQSNPEFMECLEGTEREYAGILTDFLGAKVRIKADAIDLNQGIVLDVKTSSKSFNAFKKDVLSENPQIPYFIQAYLYVAVANQLNILAGSEVRFKRFKWLFVSSRAPYSTGILEIPPEAMQRGKEHVEQFFREINDGKG